MPYSSVNVAGRFVDGSADRRKGLFSERLMSSSTSSVIVAENNMVCLRFGHNLTYIQPTTYYLQGPIKTKKQLLAEVEGTSGHPFLYRLKLNKQSMR